MSKFKTILLALPDGRYSILSPDRSEVLFIGSLSRCWEKREFFERKFSRPCVKQLELDFEL